MSITRKLSFGLLGIATLFVILGYSSYRSVAELGATLDTAVNTVARKVDLTGSVTAGFHDMKAQARGAEISLVLGRFDTKGECTACHNETLIEGSDQQFAAATATVRKAIAGLRPMVTDEAEKKTL